MRSGAGHSRAGARFDPVDVLHYAIEELGHSQAELAVILGSRSRASEILARCRPPDARDDPEDQCKSENPGRSAGAALSGRRNCSLGGLAAKGRV